MPDDTQPVHASAIQYGLGLRQACDDTVALLGLDHLGQFLAQFWAVVMAMYCDSVLHGRIYKFLLGIRRNRDRAVHLAWVFTAIHKHSGHPGLPDDSRHSPFLSFAFVI
jgi:hypothetical protein